MKYIVQLERQGWVSLEKAGHKVFVRGQAHIGDIFFDAAQLAAKLLGIETKDDIIDIINQLNGTWAFVWLNGENAVFSVDHVRSIEILYRIDELKANCYIFDNITTYLKEKDCEFDEDVMHEYLSSGFAWRNKTLIKDVLSVQAGEIVSIVNNNIVCLNYFIPYPNLTNKIIPVDEIIDEIDNAFCVAIDRLIESVGGHRIVIPLSGGYDSRLIVNYLCKRGYKNILCYTYGSEKNLDSEYSKNVATALGLPWHFVEYKDNVFLNGVDTKEVQDFCLFACNGTNTPILQEFYAIKTLKEEGIIFENDIIVPGHCFDIYAGSDLSKACYSWCVASEIYGTSTKMFYAGAYARTIKDLRCYVRENYKSSSKEAFEIFSLRENISKVIYNAVRVYEWFGLDWRMPWTDKQLTSLWINFPWAMRYGRVWFKSVVAPRLWLKEIKKLPLHGFGYNMKLRTRKQLRGLVKERIPYWIIRLFRGGNAIKNRSLGRDVFAMWNSNKLNSLKSESLVALEKLNVNSVRERLALNIKKSTYGGGVRVLYVFIAIANFIKRIQKNSI